MNQAFLSKSILFTLHLDKNRRVFVQIYAFLPHIWTKSRTYLLHQNHRPAPVTCFKTRHCDSLIRIIVIESGCVFLQQGWLLPVLIHSDNGAANISEYRNGRPVPGAIRAGGYSWSVAVCFALLDTG